MSGMPFDEGSLRAREVTFSLFSDGVTEAQDEGENEYSGGLADLLRPIAHLPAAAIVDRVFKDIDRFALRWHRNMTTSPS
jgi:hypothetical protein